MTKTRRQKRRRSHRVIWRREGSGVQAGAIGDVVVRWMTEHEAREGRPDPDDLDGVLWRAFGYNQGPEHGPAGGGKFVSLADELDRDPNAWGQKGRPRTDKRLRRAIREVLNAVDELHEVHLEAERGELPASEAAYKAESTMARLMEWGFVMTLRLGLGRDALAESRAKGGRSEGGRGRAESLRKRNGARDTAIANEMARLTDKLGSERAAANVLKRRGKVSSHRLDLSERRLREIARAARARQPRG